MTSLHDYYFCLSANRILHGDVLSPNKMLVRDVLSPNKIYQIKAGFYLASVIPA